MKLKKEVHDFEKLIHNEYVEEINRLMARYSDKTSDDIRIFIKEKQARLNTLKQEEVLYINNENQFKMIRLIELVKEYFKIIDSIENFRDQSRWGEAVEQNDKHIELKKREFEKLQKIFHDVEYDYLMLRKDHLILNVGDYLSNLHSEFYEISDKIDKGK